jgi:hypothetical protein
MILYDSSAGRKVESFQYSQSYTRSAGGHGTGRRVSFPSGRVSRSIRGIADSCLVVERRRTSDPFRFIRGIQTRRDPGRPASTCAIYMCGGVTVRPSRAVAISDYHIFTKRIYTAVRMLGFDTFSVSRSVHPLRRSGYKDFFSC